MGVLWAVGRAGPGDAEGLASGHWAERREGGGRGREVRDVVGAPSAMGWEVRGSLCSLAPFPSGSLGV